MWVCAGCANGNEATANVDPENESQLQSAIEALTKGKTLIMIAHRLSTVQDADQILVMRQGKLVESGKHNELVKKNGEYARMWENYTKTTQWHIGNPARGYLYAAASAADRENEVKVC